MKNPTFPYDSNEPRPAWIFSNYCKPSPEGHVLHLDEARREFETEAHVDDGVVRWNSNDHVPPADCLIVFEMAGCEFDPKKSEAVRKAETRDAINRYRESRRNYVPDAEERFEMRAAFGPGETVVDVITGQKFTT